jgi:protein-tyrosine phosphatase
LTHRLLVVCTANVCRSPVAAALLRRALDAAPDGSSWHVSSAGTSPVRAPLDPNTIAAAAAIGIDVAGHASRHLDAEVLRNDGTDLVLTMTRAQLREVVGLDLSWWPRTFTLKELARRAECAAPAAPGEPVEAWLARLAGDRRAASLMRPDPADDVADPYGLARRAHDETIHELDALVTTLVAHGPWQHRPSAC